MSAVPQTAADQLQRASRQLRARATSRDRQLKRHPNAAVVFVAGCPLSQVGRLAVTNDERRELAHWNLGKWALAALLCAVIPASAFDLLLYWRWNFGAQPNWSWLLVPIGPLSVGWLLLVPAACYFRAALVASLIVAAHAASMAWLLIANRWGAVGGMSLIIDLLLFVVLLSSNLGTPPHRISRSMTFWIVVIFGFCFPLALANAFIVSSRAEAIAGHRPYCIQYASQTDPYEYEPARTAFDLSALKMQARLMAGGSTLFNFEHHAVLVIEDGERQFFNWSYWRENFLDEVVNRELFKEPGRSYLAPKIACHPQAHFARTLPVWSPDTTPYEGSIGIRHFRIPEEYRPRANRGAITINAVAPNFTSYDPAKHLLPAQFYSNIVVRNAGTVDMTAFERRAASGDVRAADPEFGLSKFEARRLNLTIYTSRDGTGHLVRFIQCQQIRLYPRPPSCSHNFVADGLIFNLYISDPKEWQTAEQKLVELFASFEQRSSP
jgi:hypothetical protein